MKLMALEDYLTATDHKLSALEIALTKVENRSTSYENAAYDSIHGKYTATLRHRSVLWGAYMARAN